LRLSGKIQAAPDLRALTCKAGLVVLLGASLLAGCGSGDDANQGEVTIALPPTEPFEEPPAANTSLTEDAAANAVTEESNEASPEAEDQPEALAKKTDPPAPKAKAVAEKAPETKAAEEPADTPAPTTVAARSRADRPPLSDAAIAGTIRRIGYACPEVSSSTRMDSDPASGARRYRIVCSSGDSYQATARDGNVRFRRLTTPANR
jgi:hypothetical protein